MRAKVKFAALALSGLVVLVLASLFVWRVVFYKDEDSFTCKESIATFGRFYTHNEGIAFIGDKLDFELRVLYEREQIDVIERSLINLKLSPYKVLSHTKVRGRRYENCGEKTIRFSLQALDVDTGRKNGFRYFSSEGYEQKPDIEYTEDGLLKTKGIDYYDPPLIVSLTDGKTRVLTSPAKSYPLGENSSGEMRFMGVLSIVLLTAGNAMFLTGIGGLVAWYIFSKRRVRGEDKEQVDLSIFFPELYDKSGETSCQRLVRLYFSLKEHKKFMSDETLVRKVEQVFGGKYTEEDATALLKEVREFLEQKAREETK